jgi:LemA protein
MIALVVMELMVAQRGGDSGWGAFMPACVVVAGVGPLVLPGGVGVYKNPGSGPHQVRGRGAGGDTPVERRYDLIPNLVETVKGYATHERSVLQMVIEARTRAVASTGSPAAQAKDENVLVGALKQLFAVAEAYPNLKASENFLALQHQLTETEDRIQAARRFYNANVRDYNNRVQMFPTNVLAGMFHFQPEEFFEIDSALERQAPAVGFGQQG